MSSPFSPGLEPKSRRGRRSPRPRTRTRPNPEPSSRHGKTVCSMGGCSLLSLSLSLSCSLFPFSSLLFALHSRSFSLQHVHTLVHARTLAFPTSWSRSIFFSFLRSRRTVANLSGVASPHYKRPRPTVEI